MATKFTGTLPTLKHPLKVEFVNHLGENGHWDFPEQMGVGGYVGFIYVIYDNYLDKAYLGKKNYFGAGALNKGKESNWKKYTSSSKSLNENIAARPRNQFEFYCLEQYKAKGALAYAETWSLCMVEAPTSKQWYNTLIEKVSWAVREPVSERHKLRLLTFKERLQRARNPS